MKGTINSFLSMGAVDGPGVRYVIFMQGCPLRCLYCHNPDTWKIAGKEYSVDEVCEKILRYRSYFGEEGGVTVSGGEPLIQWEFVSELFKKLRECGIHTALDTSGTGNSKVAGQVLKYTDLVICDLKFSTDEEYLEYCGGDLREVLTFLKLTEQMQIPLWVRHVVVPDLGDSRARALDIVKMAKEFTNLRKIEFLPFKKLCIPKYEAMGIPFPLEEYRECPDSLIKELNDLMD
jgi:pyruvate formate-lyase 1-activating enzyme